MDKINSRILDRLIKKKYSMEELLKILPKNIDGIINELLGNSSIRIPVFSEAIFHR